VKPASTSMNADPSEAQNRESDGVSSVRTLRSVPWSIRLF
jgi:hypothetical protein